MSDPRHGNEPWPGYGPPPPTPGYGPPPNPPLTYPAYPQYAPAPPPKRPNHILHLILTVLTCGLWSSVWIVLAARYWNVHDYRNPAEHPGMQRRTWIAIGCIAVVSLVGGIIEAAVPSPSPAGISSAATPQTPADTTSAQPPAPSQPAATVKPKPKATTTVAQRQAMEAAQSYVDMSGFSRAGLIGQLTSSAGNGFELADAVYAVDHIKVDWNAEAVESAKSYLKLGGFSRAGLIQQLHSKVGAGFTLKQATYAADKVGL